MHNAVVFNDFDELAAKVFGHKGFKDGYSIEARRLFLGNRVERYRLDGIPDFLFPFLNENQLQQLGRLRQLQQLERLKRLQQLEQLQQLERLEHLRFYSVSYDLVPIKPNSVVYCDPPYRGTADYGGEFDHDKFLDWCHKQTEPVFISEYDISDKRFRPVRGIEKRSLLAGPISGKTKDKNIEKIYINQAGAKRFL